MIIGWIHLVFTTLRVMSVLFLLSNQSAPVSLLILNTVSGELWSLGEMLQWDSGDVLQEFGCTVWTVWCRFVLGINWFLGSLILYNWQLYDLMRFHRSSPYSRKRLAPTFTLITYLVALFNEMLAPDRCVTPTGTKVVLLLCTLALLWLWATTLRQVQRLQDRSNTHRGWLAMLLVVVAGGMSVVQNFKYSGSDLPPQQQTVANWVLVELATVAAIPLVFARRWKTVLSETGGASVSASSIKDTLKNPLLQNHFNKWLRLRHQFSFAEPPHNLVLTHNDVFRYLQELKTPEDNRHHGLPYSIRQLVAPVRFISPASAHELSCDILHVIMERIFSEFVLGDDWQHFQKRTNTTLQFQQVLLSHGYDQTQHLLLEPAGD